MTSKTDIPSSSFSPPPFRKLTYDVFLSFSGEDTRNNFTDNLYTALIQRGIFTFRDDEELRKGESIGPNLLKAIEESRYVIVIFSKNYANSSWCLDEIAKVAECMEKGQEVFPVFYHVDPSEVRSQRGDYFGKAFEKHRKHFKADKVQRWKYALQQVGNISGWHIKDGYESKYIQKIVQPIFTKLNQIISTSQGLVGMDSHLEKLLSYLALGSQNVRIVGICGMGGIGKTTIAEVVYERIRPQFEGYCFLHHVREETVEKKNIVRLQEKLISTLLETEVKVEYTTRGKDLISHRFSTKKVLIVLDDVDQAYQLEALCHHTWFGPGSRIIITSRNKHLLSLSRADEVYEVNHLSDAAARQLFNLKASKENQLVGDFLKLSEEFLKYADGLPLAIKVLGSSVHGRTVKVWSSALDSLKNNLENGILDVLMVSFKGLKESEKRIFLDIACFFKGMDVYRVKRILQGNNALSPDYCLQVLLDKSMITLSGEKLWMHDKMQELGWAIVCQESNSDPGRRSRLWRSNEIIRILDRSKATSMVESISLQGPTKDDVVHSLNGSFSNMENLRLLKICNVKFSGNIEHLSEELQYLEWHECPLISFPSDFQPDKLVELHMHSSLIEQLWRGEKEWSMLRFIDLRGSKDLRSTPDFSKVPHLEHLDLHDCTSLINVHPSLGCLKKLDFLDMTNCKSVESLPPFSNLESLWFLSLKFCSRLKKFPKIEGDMKALWYLSLDGTSIEVLPPSVACLTGLTGLYLMTSNTDVPSSPPLPSSSSRKITYDVFLSSRGTDTRTNFTDHLYTALKKKGIFTFMDDEELERGESAAPSLLEAIEESIYVVVVFSRHYANSSSCLDEIAKVADCMKQTGQKVLPVYYDVDPFDVRRQTGEYFEHHKWYEGDPGKVQRWKDALLLIGNLRGWHIQNGSEAKVIQEVVQQIFTELIISTSEGLVGMVSPLTEMLSHLDIGCPDVRIVGIYGMGGIGKTTLAQVVFDRVKTQFESYCFLENVREENEKQGTIYLQKQLLFNLLNTNVNVQNTKLGRDIIRDRLCTKRVLIVLDDVDQVKQFEALCDRTWFGRGSRIILTSRDEHLLRVFQADQVYKVNLLSDAAALQLFSLNASKGCQLGGEFLKLSEEFLKYADGLPLAIKVLGSFVRGRNVKLWSSALDRLKISPEKRIINVLRWSFDGLGESEKQVFLDIACFFKGKSLDRVRRILQGSNAYCPDLDIQVLLDKSMITQTKGKLWMHEPMQALGWEIVCQECNIKPGRRSRLWRSSEIIYTLNRNKATGAVQSISLIGQKYDNRVHSLNDSFSEMYNLRLLRIKDVKFSGNIKYLSNELQYLQWHECPLDFFPSNFQPDNLVELKLHSSCIQQLWIGENGWSMLRFIDLRGSKFLRSTPDFTKVPHLKKLNLHDCTSLVNIHPSLGCLKKLDVLDMSNCKSVESLPPFSNLESLRYLSLAFCSRLKKFPEIEGDMKALLYLFLDWTSIEELPNSVACLTGLKNLQLYHCKKLLRLPSAIQCLKGLILSGCANINELPDDMKNLKYLRCHGCKGLASESGKGLRSLWSLSGLIQLDLSDCSLMDGAIPDDLSSLISLTEFNLSGNNFVRLPDSISQLSKLHDLDLSNCTQLQLVPKLAPCVRFVNARGCNSLTDFPNQIKPLTSPGAGFTVIDSLNSDNSSLGETIKKRLPTPSEHTQLMHHLVKTGELDDNLLYEVLERGLPTEYRSEIFPRDEIPDWFSFKSEGNSVSIPIPPKLIYDDKWHGVAVCAVFSENRSNKSVISFVDPGSEISNQLFQCTLTINHHHFRMRPALCDEERFRPSSHLLSIFYLPKVELPMLYISNMMMSAIFATSHPSIWEIQICAIRLVYEQDVGWYDKLFPQIKYVRLNEVHDAILNSGWISRVDTFWKWEPCTLPVEEDSNTILQRKNLKFVLPRFLEAKNSVSHFMFNLSGCPGWCKNTFDNDMPLSSPVSFILPQNLHKSNKWKGIVVYASIAEKVQHSSEEDCHLYLELTIGEYHMNLSETYVRTSKEPHQLLFIYIPRAEIIQEFSQASQTYPNMVFSIDSPGGEVQRRGFDIVNRQEGLEEFVETIIHCMQRADVLKFHENMVVKSSLDLLRLKGDSCTPNNLDARTPWERKFELLSQKYRKWDWSASGFRCHFFGAEFCRKKWFMHFNEGNSAEIQLPPNFLNDPNWLGLAVCAIFWRSHEDKNIILDTPDSDSIVLSWHLEFDIAGARLCTFKIDQHVLKLRPQAPLADKTYYNYVPRTDLKLRRQCSSAKVIFTSSSPCLGMRRCAIRLVYKEDIEDLVQSLTLCELP